MAAATRSYVAPVVALTGLTVGFTSAVLIAAAVSHQPAQTLQPPVRPPSIMDSQLISKFPHLPADTLQGPEPGADDEVTAERLDAPLAFVGPPAPITPMEPTPEPNVTAVKPAAPAQVIRTLAATHWTPDQMQALLLRVPEVALVPPSIKAVPKTGRSGGGSHPVLAVINARDDLRGLPVRRGSEAQLPRSEGDAMRDASVLLRKELGSIVGTISKNKKLTIRPEVISARPATVTRLMHQMLQVESLPLRTMLLAQLTKIHNPAASRALAHRAVYEPLPDMRQTAVQALASRSPSEYLPVLLDALGSLWAPAADHAADALVALSPAGAIPELVSRLDAPSLTAPTPDGKGDPVVHELVRINHNRNCLLCHGQSASKRDGVRVAVPNPLKPLPSPFSLDTYEGGGKGGSNTGDPNTTFVRPDITYLQQDFSWALPVADHGYWPVMQRYDFVVRTRPAGPADMVPSDVEPLQKKAVVRALKALTGQDFGDRAADWRTGLALTMK